MSALGQKPTQLGEVERPPSAQSRHGAARRRDGGTAITFDGELAESGTFEVKRQPRRDIGQAHERGIKIKIADTIGKRLKLGGSQYARQARSRIDDEVGRFAVVGLKQLFETCEGRGWRYRQMRPRASSSPAC